LSYYQLVSFKLIDISANKLYYKAQARYNRVSHRKYKSQDIASALCDNSQSLNSFSRNYTQVVSRQWWIGYLLSPGV